MVDKKRKVRKNGLKKRKLKMYLVFPKKAFETSFSEDMLESMTVECWNLSEKNAKTIRDYIQ